MNYIATTTKTILAASLALTSAFSWSSTGAAQSARGSGTGIASAGVSINGDPVLTGFKFNWTGYDDHHLRQISVEPDAYQNRVKVGYYDKNFDDRYNWKVDLLSYNRNPRNEGRESGSCKGRCSQSISMPAGYTFLLTGFSFAFQGTDHHIDEIGVWERGGKIFVAFNDKNDDDQFNWSVSYILVPKSTFRTLQTSQGTSRSHASSTISQGAMMRGFYLDYSSTDHEIHTVGVELNSGKLNVNYRDKNGDDEFGWFVDWAAF